MTAHMKGFRASLLTLTTPVDESMRASMVWIGACMLDNHGSQQWSKGSLTCQRPRVCARYSLTRSSDSVQADWFRWRRERGLVWQPRLRLEIAKWTNCQRQQLPGMGPKDLHSPLLVQGSNVSLLGGRFLLPPLVGPLLRHCKRKPLLPPQRLTANTWQRIATRKRAVRARCLFLHDEHF